MFNNKVILITGGTGSCGNHIAQCLLNKEIKEIRIFSRDEKKQYDMQRRFENPKLKYFIGDIRDISSLQNAVYGADYIFHTAALKQVPICENFPIEAVKTNVLGTDNLLSSSIASNVQRVVCLSTDKAVYPINAMGASKALMEKVTTAYAARATASHPIISCVRYGNIMCSRGSVIPLFIEQIKNNSDITITHPMMTRFIVSMDDIMDLILKSLELAQQGDIFVQKSTACTIETLATALRDIFNSKSKIRVIGIRPGEKMHESLISYEEAHRSIDMGDFIKIPINTDTTKSNSTIINHNSSETRLLDIDEVKRKLISLEYIRNELN